MNCASELSLDPCAFPNQLSTWIVHYSDWLEHECQGNTDGLGLVEHGYFPTHLPHNTTPTRTRQDSAVTQRMLRYSLTSPLALILNPCVKIWTLTNTHTHTHTLIHK